MSVPAVSVEALTIKYGDFIAVDSLDLRAYQGRITAVLGPNGAGKTSTIECCEGLRIPTSGVVRVLGLDPLRDHKELVTRMGVMLQDGGVYPSARVRETVELYVALYGNVADSEELIRICGLKDRSTATWRQLSGGERQRLSLALALTAKPEVAFLDEPTSGVDITGRSLIRDTLRKMAAEGCAVVVATHELDEAERIADDVVIINKGRVALAGALAELRRGESALRFVSSNNLDVAALSTAIGEVVERSGENEFAVRGGDGPELIAKLSGWLASNGYPMNEVRTGGESLADIFTRTVGEAVQ